MSAFRRISVLFCVALLSCIGTGLLYYWMHTAVIRKNREIGTKMQQLTGTSATEEQLADLKKALTDHAGDAERVDANFIGSNDVVVFIQLIETFSQNTNLAIEISSLVEDAPLGSEAVPEPFELLHVQFVGSGAWKDILNLLVFVESMPNIIRIEQVQFKKVGGGLAETGHWNGFFSLTAVKKISI